MTKIYSDWNDINKILDSGEKNKNYIIDVNKLNPNFVYEILIKTGNSINNEYKIINSKENNIYIEAGEKYTDSNKRIELSNIILEEKYNFIFSYEIEYLDIYDSEIKGNLYHGEVFRHNEMEDIFIIDSKINKSIFNTIKFKNIHLENTDIGDSVLRLRNTIDGGKIIINGLVGKGISLNSINSDYLYINGENKSYEDITISKININNNNSIFEIRNIITEQLIIKDLVILNLKTNIANIRITDRVLFYETIFTNTLFNNIEFPKKNDSIIFIKSVVFNNTNFVNIDWNNFNLKSSYSNKNNDHERYFINSIGKQNIYRQLKYSMDQSNNYIDGNYFYQKELDSILFGDDNNKKINNPFKNLKLIPIGFNKLFSNYGNDYILVFLWIILLTTIYILIENFENIFLLKHIGSGNYNIDKLPFLTYLDELANKINPFSGLNEKVKFWELLRKILITYLIYSFGVAIKRTSKR